MRIKRALAEADTLSWFLVESDSDDNSIDVLRELTVEIERFRFVSLGNLREKLPQRTNRIAHCRNVYLKELYENELYSAVDFVAIADFDGINTLIDADAVKTCWSREDWDVCTANQAGPYYDVWALRHEVWCPNDCWEQLRFLMQFESNKERALHTSVYGKMIYIPRESDWIPVESAYGGFALYRRSCLQGAFYCGLTDSGEQVCEHVALHVELSRRGCRIFINPQLINAAWTEHSKQMDLDQRIKRSLVTWLRKLVPSIARPE